LVGGYHTQDIVMWAGARWKNGFEVKDLWATTTRDGTQGYLARLLNDRCSAAAISLQRCTYTVPVLVHACMTTRKSGLVVQSNSQEPTRIMNSGENKEGNLENLFLRAQQPIVLC
jgi:hypothetical protein